MKALASSGGGGAAAGSTGAAAGGASGAGKGLAAMMSSGGGGGGGGIPRTPDNLGAGMASFTGLSQGLPQRHLPPMPLTINQGPPAQAPALPAMPSQATMPALPTNVPMAPSVNPSSLPQINAPAMPQFDVTAPTGTKPKNYTPYDVQLNAMPLPAVIQQGGGPATADFFNVTPASGTKPKNYVPVSIQMAAPSPVGADAMMQFLQQYGRG